MPISQNVLNRLHLGRSVAVEVMSAQPDMKAYIMITPITPLLTHSDAWIIEEFTERRLRSPSFINGYEIFFIEHHEKYTDTDWGNDEDIVMQDESTKVKRHTVNNIEEVESLLKDYDESLTHLSLPQNFDSAILNGVYLSFPQRKKNLPDNLTSGDK